MKLLLTGLLLTLTLVAHAEVYRWTDANGKVHYSDKKSTAKAEDITRDVKKQNIDSSSEEQKKVAQILRKENEADRTFSQEQQDKQNTARQKRCDAMRNRFHTLSGRVQFIDDQGKIVNVSEQEKQKNLAELKKKIETECF